MKKKGDGLSHWQVIFMALCTGLIVANIYYCQPLIVLISKEFKVAQSSAGSITFFTQAGYACGLLFFVPLGDKLERRGQIVATSFMACLSLVCAALSGSLNVLRMASFFIGFTSIIPQLILPLSAELSPPQRRGKIIGSIMSGLLIGILLSRTFSGLVGAWLGWRSMFWIAAFITGSLMTIMHFGFPTSKANYSGNYFTLMQSLLKLFRTQPLLREASAINALAFGSFGMFWTTMVLHLTKAPFNFHSGKIGLFGLAAAAGALVAPFIGGSADKGNSRSVIGYGILISGCSFGVFYFFSQSVWGMIGGIILLDLGLQAIHVSNQTRVYALMPEARNRLNTIFMTISFVGTSMGSALGLWFWNMSGWTAICAAGFTLLLLAFLVYYATYKKLKYPTR
ncbi:MAG: MFS transporter [Flavisolibacter sp.]